MPNNKEPETIKGAALYVLGKHGLWALIACIFIATTVYDRQMLLDAVRENLTMNTESMRSMSIAIAELNSTMTDRKRQAAEAHEMMKSFSEDVVEIHAKQNEMLDKIHEKVSEP